MNLNKILQKCSILDWKSFLFSNFAILIIEKMASKNLNRIKVMLAERNQTNKWLAEQVGKDPATVSKWVTNASQPSLEMFFKIAKVLDGKYTDLICEQEL